VDIDVPSAVEVFTTLRYINVHLLTYLLTYFKLCLLLSAVLATVGLSVCPSVRPSVRVSVTFGYCIKTAGAMDYDYHTDEIMVQSFRKVSPNEGFK